MVADEYAVIGVATTPADLHAAHQLIRQAYTRAGLTAPAQQRGEVLIDKQAGSVVYTVTLVLDGPEGLPLDAVFGDVARLPGRAEVCRLAGQEGQPFAAGVPLMEFAIERAKALGVATMLNVVHPKHARFYRRLFGAELLTDEIRSYGAVGGAPAVVMRLSV